MAIQSISGGNPAAYASPPPGDQVQRQAAAAAQRAEAEKTAELAPTPETKKSVREIQKEDVKKAVDDVQNFVNTKNQDILFSIDEDLGKTVVKVVDRSTKELIRQFPSEDMLQIAKALDKLQGLLVKQQA
ncbi:flagellar protein FlaG [Dechloromonas denitrificans]|uniref:flagellar protein FlaG n=1 Tax=Dechloromonas denitrificans TaxID=281362 RepID=UPI001CF8905F|nr:flagellar protein FlaG [Dechloromonas denitrificans]UCV10913.1 flagellar protein FlaG [Dechloromonas denitrificans]